MTTILVMILLLADGGSIEVRADSIEICEAMSHATGIAPVEITDEFGTTLSIVASYCETADVLPVVEIGGEAM